MHFCLVLLIPLASTVTTVSSKRAALTPKHSGMLKKSDNATVPLRSTIINLQAPKTIDPALVFCTESACSDGCMAFLFRVEENPFDFCMNPIGASPYSSLFISNPNHTVIPDIVGVGSDCSNLLEVPDLNTCFDVDPPADFFGLFPPTSKLVGPPPGITFNIQNVGTKLFITTLDTGFGSFINVDTLNDPPAPSQQWVTNPSGFVDGIVFNQIESTEELFFDIDINGGIVVGGFPVIAVAYKTIPSTPNVFIMVSNLPTGQNFTIQSPPDGGDQLFF